MLRIVSHLECLLVVHDCVIVPRLGGFVLHAASASYSTKDHFFLPMRREIGFNTTLRYNDGLLTESYMKSYGVDCHKAYRMIEDDADEIKSMLFRGQKVSLGTIGSFSLSTEGQVLFEPVDAGFQSMESYGFSSFGLRTIQELQREQAVVVAEQRKAQGDNVFYIPINKRWLQGIAGVAAAVAMFLIVSTPVKQMDSTAYTANFIPTEVLASGTAKSSVARKVPTEVVTTRKKAESTKVKAEQPKSKDIYYVVVSSLNSVKQADAFIASMDRSVFKRANKLVETKKVRVYADKFDSREKADTYMDKLRKKSKYKDAWVYIP